VLEPKLRLTLNTEPIRYQASQGRVKPNVMAECGETIDTGV